MANKRISMIDLKQLLRLKIAGESNRMIAQILNRSRNTINEYVRLFDSCSQSLEELCELNLKELHDVIEVKKIPNADVGTKLTDPRYQKLLDHKDAYLKKVNRTGGTYQQVWYEYKNSFPDGYGYTQFKQHLQSFKEQRTFSMPMQHDYGDKLFIDYTGKKLPIVDRSTGLVKEAEVFIGILGASNYTYVEASWTQRQEDFVSCTVNCLEYLGGVPKALVPDNLKSAVEKPDKYEPKINRLYKSLSEHYNTIVYPARVRKPKDKALVEGAVKLVYQRIFYHLSEMTFFTLAELNEQIHLLLEKYNDRFFYQQKESRRDRFEQKERALLKPLPSFRFEPKEVKRAKVQNNCHVYSVKNYYSVPYSYVGKHVQVHYNNISVEVYYNYERIAIHKRAHGINVYTTIKTHMPSHHQFVMDWCPERFVKWGKRIGTSTEAYIKGILERYTYPEQGYKSCIGVLNLAKIYSDERLEKACARGLFFEKYSYTTIKRILSLKLDSIDLEEEKDIEQQLKVPFQNHDNLRGATYYDNL